MTTVDLRDPRAIDRVRHAVSVCLGALSASRGMSDEISALVDEMQELDAALEPLHLDAIVLTRLEGVVVEPTPAGADPVAEAAERRQRALDLFADRWSDAWLTGFLDRLERAMGAPGGPAATNAQRVAAIDVGSNSVRLIVAEALPDGRYRVLDDEKVTARLGAGLASSGEMREDAMALAAESIKRMCSIAEGYRVSAIRIVGTAACRDASNGGRFAGLVRERCGREMEIISAEQEARLSFTSVRRAFDLDATEAAVVDVGGGSTEIVLSEGGEIRQIALAPIGAVRVTERFGGPEESAGPRFGEMISWIDERIAEALGGRVMTPSLMVGAGGTFTSIASLSMHRRGRLSQDLGSESTAIRQHEMTLDEIRALVEELRTLAPSQRADLSGISESRAGIIVGGAAIVERVMTALGATTLRAHDRGVRDGVLLAMTDEAMGASRVEMTLDEERRASLDRFAGSCEYDRAHCEQVATLSLMLYDALSERWAEEDPDTFNANCRSMLLAAATLHDVGYHINYDRHHRHSYHLIVNADLAGYSAREQEIIANVARYHRKSAPKPKHPQYAKLDEADKRVVRRLSAILRVCDGLDRSHKSLVAAVRPEFSGSGRRVVRLIVDAAEHPDVDLWGATRKSALFEAEYAGAAGTDIELAWSGGLPDGHAGDA